MNGFVKKASVFLTCMLVLFPLLANDRLAIENGDVGTLRLYDADGRHVTVSEEVLSQVGAGWIVKISDTPLLLKTPFGSVNLFEDSILVTGDLSADSPSLYLVEGKATFTTDTTFDGTLSVTTPVSQFAVRGTGQIFVVSTQEEESVTSFGGSVIATNDISGARTVVRPFGKLYLNDPYRAVATVESGYYLTYSPYPDLAEAERLAKEMTSVMIPSKPNVSLPTTTPIPIPSRPGRIEATVTAEGIPSAPPFKGVSIARAVPSPPGTATYTVTAVKAPVPAVPSKINTSLVPVAPTALSVTIEPLPPVVPEAAVTTVPEPPTAIVKDIEPVAPETPESPLAVQPAIISTSESAPADGKFGLQATYGYTFDGTDGNSQSHSLTVGPYLNLGSFAFRAQASVNTSDLSTFDIPLLDTPDDLPTSIAYLSQFIGKLKVGYETSPFFLALDDQQRSDTDLTGMTAPLFGESGKLGLYNKVTFSRISLITRFDDLHLDRFLDGKSQYGSLSVLYSGPGNYPFLMSISSLVRIASASGTTYDLFPSVSFRFPVLDRRDLRMGIVVSANSYLPVYPDLDAAQLFDPNTLSLFPNYLLNSGLLLHAGSFDAKAVLGIQKGESTSMMANDFDLSATNSSFFFLGSFGYETERMEARVLWNLPFASDLSIATLGSGRKADLLQLTVGFDLGRFSLSTGVQQLGIMDGIAAVFDGSADPISLFGGEYASSFLHLAYRIGFGTLEARALFPASSASYTVPRMTVSATIDLGKEF